MDTVWLFFSIVASPILFTRLQVFLTLYTASIYQCLEIYQFSAHRNDAPWPFNCGNFGNFLGPNLDE